MDKSNFSAAKGVSSNSVSPIESATDKLNELVYQIVQRGAYRVEIRPNKDSVQVAFFIHSRVQADSEPQEYHQKLQGSDPFHLTCEEFRDLYIALSDRIYHWPRADDGDFECADPLGRVLFAPDQGPRILFDVLIEQQRKSRHPTLILHNINSLEVSAFSSLVESTSLLQEFTTEIAVSNGFASGIIVANLSPSPRVLDGVAPVLATRPDAIFFKNPSYAFCSEIARVAERRLVLVGIEEKDPVNLLVKVVALLDGHSEVAQRVIRNLRFSIALQWLPRLCRNCAKREPLELPISGLSEEMQPQAGSVYRADGCALCSNSGFRGQIHVESLLKVGPDIQKVLLNPRVGPSLQERAIEAGYRPIATDGISKSLRGLTSIEAVEQRFLR